MGEEESIVQEPSSISEVESVATSTVSLPEMAPSIQPRIEQAPYSPADRCCGDTALMAQPPIYAIGRIEARFSTPAAEKEFAQAVGRSETTSQTNQKAFHTALTKRENRYLVRKLCWVLKIQGIDTYILVPRDPSDLELLVDAIRPAPSPMDMDVVIGHLGQIAPPETCNGLMVPIVTFDQIYSFDWKTLIKSVPKPENVKAEQFEAVAEEVLQTILDNIDNAGASDEDRARNYLIMRYGQIYAKCVEYSNNDFGLSAVDAHPSHLSGTRNIIDVVFSFTHRKTDVVEKQFVRVDVTEEYPFLVSKLSTYFDR